MKMSDEEISTLTSPRNKNLVFTIEERKLLLLLVNKHYDVVTNKRVDGTSLLQKNQAWEAINKDYLEHTNLVRLPRTQQQLKRCWENMKCKAKKCDPMSVKLLRWGEQQYRLQQNGLNVEKITNGSLNIDNLRDDTLEFSSVDGRSNCDEENHFSDGKPDTQDNTSTLNFTEERSISSKTLKLSNCAQCSCHTQETAAKLELIHLEKQQKKELHSLMVQLERDRIKRERELHKLAVHELTLRVENERRRAEILEKELGNS